jgi:tetratricopeptide (TPR) repeat protein
VKLGWVTLLLLALCAGSAPGCADRSGSVGRERSTSASAQKQAVSPELLAFLSKARAAHHNADLLEAKEDLLGASDAVRRIVTGPRPSVSPELEEVLADAHARLADLESRRGDFEEALAQIDRGLGLAKELSHYRGHLFETKGVVHERWMVAHEKAGNEEKAASERALALAAFEQAIEIQDEVIRKLLPAPGDEAVPGATSAAPSVRPDRP